MKKRVNNIAAAAVIASMATTSVSAFDLKLIGSAQPAVSWQAPESSRVTYTKKTSNIGFELGGYKNRDHEGFGFGIHVGVSTPVGSDFMKNGTFEFGIAPGYSITKELAAKIELGVGFKQGYEIYNSSDTAGPLLGSFTYGLSVEYVISDHFLIGGAGKVWSYYHSGHGSSDPTLVPELSVGYRF